MLTKNIEEARHFFQTYPLYSRLFTRFKAKYQSLGKIGGTVNIADFSEEDLNELATFFGMGRMEFLEKWKGKLSLQAFERQLGKTKFEGIQLFELLEHFFGEEILSNEQIRDNKEKYMVELFQDAMNRFQAIAFWFRYLQRKSADTYWIYRLIEGDKAAFYQYAQTLQTAFQQLPDDGERLAMFSQHITQNPHAFDQNTELGRLWLHLLAVHEQGDEACEVRVPTDSEAISQLLETYMLFRDDITNFVTVINIQAETEDGVHPVWNAAAAMGRPAVLNVPIRELTPLTKAYPFNWTRGKKVWIVENSGVFSSIVDYYPTVPLLCTHGQFKLASLRLMDLLVKEGCELMYAGDFDPEGISMLQRLLLRYKEKAVPWRMDTEHYEASKPQVPLTDERLAKLKSIKMPELQSVKEAILARKKAGYQEALVTLYVSDLV